MNNTRREVVQEWDYYQLLPPILHSARTLVLLEFIKVGWSNTANFFPEPIHLSRNSSPEDLIKHGISHVIVSPTLLVFRYSECVLSISHV